jgi:DNA polymerase-3 subunit alpha
MQIAQKLSGFTAGEADILRRAMGKKKRTELEKQKQRFIEGAVKNGINKETAAGIFLKIEPFAEYGFNKSHAAAYAIIAYQTAYLKAYFPNEFFAASMTMDSSNQNKLSEFHEELKRLNIKIIRPDINNCFADFRSDDKNFYYALGSIKSVGFEAISNIVDERIKNGNFKSISDFINRVNPKNINKLQLEGLVKAGAFDNLNNNRQCLYNSIPNLILKSKNIFENKIANQIDLFNLNENKNDDNLLSKIKDWKFEERLTKEFESVGFFISNHPINQYKEIFNDYKIIDYKSFLSDNSSKQCIIAATLLKIQERKTSKGNSYAVIKLTDLSSVFELFIFSEILELNRNILLEGNSLLITLNKNLSNDENRFKRINVNKITLIKELYNKPISNLELSFEDINKISNLHLSETDGKTNVILKYKDNQKLYVFKLKKNRKIDRNQLNLIKKEGISTQIN